jgi:hypothetical protein
VAGPARLSLADRGLTFATTTRTGLCITFRSPVPGIDPWGIFRPAQSHRHSERPEGTGRSTGLHGQFFDDGRSPRPKRLTTQPQHKGRTLRVEDPQPEAPWQRSRPVRDHPGGPSQGFSIIDIALVPSTSWRVGARCPDRFQGLAALHGEGHPSTAAAASAAVTPRALAWA